MSTPALIVIDFQRAFDSPGRPPRNNPACEANLATLAGAWQAARLPIVLVRHEEPESVAFAPGSGGTDFKAELDGVRADLVFAKSVNSAFLGEVDLDVWLRRRGITELVLVGIQTNWCVETTARMGGNLGYDVRVVLDATHTFDAAGPDGTVLSADQLAAATATNLHSGGFATITSTEEVLRGLTVAAA